MRNNLVIILCFLSSMLFGIEWSDNNVIKFNSTNLFDNLQDYDNISAGDGFISSSSADTNAAWLLTCGITINDNYVFSSAFVNMAVTDADEAASNSYVTLKIFDNNDGEIIHKQVFYKTGSMELNNIFLKDASIYLEIAGGNAIVYSFGITRKGLSLLQTNDLSITPLIIFNGESTLNISLSLNYPALVDILIFDKKGTVIDAVCRQRFFREGMSALTWDPGSSRIPGLASGNYFIYFKAETLSGKSAEIVKKLIFVDN